MKHFICAAGGVIGGIIATLFGGWTEGLLVLVILMAIDYFSGLVVAGVFHRSPKSANGGLESKAGLKGLMRKIFVLALVAVAHLIDRLIGTNYIRDAVVIAFCLNEVISILENAGLMGIPIPKVLQKAIDVLRDKAGEDTETASSDAPAAEKTRNAETARAKDKPPDGEEEETSGRPVQARSASGPRWGPAGSAEELSSEAQAMPLGGFAPTVSGRPVTAPTETEVRGDE